MADFGHAVMAELQQRHDQQLVHRFSDHDSGALMSPLSRIVYLATRVGLAAHLRESHESDYDLCPRAPCVDMRGIVECVDEIDRGGE